MSRKLDFKTMAKQIIQDLGGTENLSQINHCATRLRVKVRDVNQVDDKSLTKIEGVIAVEKKSEDVQVIVGQIIEDLYLEVEKQAGKVSAQDVKSNDKKTPIKLFSDFLQLMAGIMSPVVPSLIAAGFLTCLLIILNLVFGIDSSNPTYVILNNLAQSVFYFLPIFVAYTSARKFDTEPVLALLLASWLLYPDWVNLVNQGGGYTSYFGIPTLLVTYNGAVLQIILSVWVMSKIDQVLKKVLPISVRHFLKPFLLILFTSVITLTLTGPLGGLFTNYIASFIDFVRTNASWATVPAILILSYTLGVLMPGFHLALIPIATTSLATYGYDDVINIWFFCATITPGFIALAVALKTKKKSLKEIAFPASVSALLGGISEPTTYGISYKMPRIYFSGAVVSIITGIYAGLVNLKSYGFGGYSLTNILLYLGPDNDQANFVKALVGVAIMASGSFIAVFLVKWDDSGYEDIPDSENSVAVNSAQLKAPAQGTYIKQEDIPDSAFSKGLLGACFAIEPQSGSVYSPISGVINSISPSHHAITIQGDGNASVMVHIGIDTDKISPDDIRPAVKVGQRVQTSSLIADVDLEKFKEKNVNPAIITILLNSNQYKTIRFDSQRSEMIAGVL